MKYIEPIVHFPCQYNEEWRYITSNSIPNVDLYQYLISNYGRAYSMYRRRLLIPQVSMHGYLYCHFHKNDGSSTHSPGLHRIEMIEFCYRPDYKDLEVNHIDGNKTNNRLDNLEWCTHRENMIHAYETGLEQTVISKEQADKIGYLLSTEKYSIREIADITNAPEDIIRTISACIAWKDVYYKYNLDKRKYRQYNCSFTEDQVKDICKYFQDNAYKYINPIDLYKAVCRDILNMNGINKKVYRSLYKIYTHSHYTDISKDYTW